MQDNTALSESNTARRRWMSVLARARAEELEQHLTALNTAPAFRWLRQPEIGMVMLRARTGGTGAQFNLGEATLTRCVLRTDTGFTGVSYALGRDRRHAELAALFDALLQDSQHTSALERDVIEPLEAQQRQRREQESRKAAATKVDFYTLARGDDD
ncbi:MAG TPA: phosphonate C-P lyase system protein PhnG [Burkholderiales bacterium]|nr:phosphonate C-P lyase system protein PhnG [Burkholderiales bacterium]